MKSGSASTSGRGQAPGAGARDGEELVSVVIPLHNAAWTIGATLASVRAQTHSALEIIVVDDGSTDSSAAVVAAHAADDRRIRLFRQANAGVAAARNRGAAEARADYLAFVDADDLWAPNKIALQLRALHAGGPRAGLVYTWFAVIDAHGRVISTQHRPMAEGQMLRDLCRRNQIGNGSSSLMRRAAFDAVGGYDTSLRARNAQGCEDLLIYLRIAERFEFRVVPRHLTGYRKTPGNMSSDTLQMLRSCEIVLSDYRESHPEYAAELDAHMVDMIFWLFVHARVRHALPLARRLYERGAGELLRLAPSLAARTLRARAPDWLKAPLHRLRRKGGAFRPVYLEMDV